MKRIAGVKSTQLLASELPIRLHLRTDLHLVRKAYHVVMGALTAFIYLLSGMSPGTGVMILGTVLGIVFLVETARLRIPSFNEKVLRLWAPFMRTHEYSRPSAVLPYVASMIVAILIFPKPVAVLSILYLAVGDPMASLVGILYGDKSYRLPSGKSLIGTAAGVMTCVLLGVVFLNSLALPPVAVAGIALVGGVAGGKAELLPIDVDDNLSIPIASGFVLWLAFLLFGV